jgi:hypothetical protein
MYKYTVCVKFMESSYSITAGGTVVFFFEQLFSFSDKNPQNTVMPKMIRTC